VGVAVLVAGAVLAGTIRHHPTDDDQCYSNSSLMAWDQPTSFSNFPMPTKTSDIGNSATPIFPSPTATVERTSHIYSGEITTPLYLTISPSPIV
jgi:hypothetical protein